MTKDQVIKIRDMFHNAGIKVAAFGDNEIIMDENIDVVIWDDDNEILYSLARTKTTAATDYPDPNKVVYYTILGYDVIQYIQASSDYNTFKKDIITKIPVNDAEREEKILDWFANVNGKTLIARPGTRTMKEIATESPELYDAVLGEGKAEELVKSYNK